MVSKLVLKGEKPTKKKKSRISNSAKASGNHATATHTPSVKTLSKNSQHQSAWRNASSLNHLHGPAVILARLQVAALASDLMGQIMSSSDLTQEMEPTSTHQVFVLIPLQFEEKKLSLSSNTEQENDIGEERQFSFKTARDTYLTDAGNSTLHAKATSIGPQQIFTVQKAQKQDEWVISSTTSKMKLNFDDDSKKFCLMPKDVQCTLRIRVQYKYSRELDNLQQSRGITSAGELSVSTMEKKVGHKLTTEEIKSLRKAYKEGTWNEALLDLRQKSKHDSRC